MSNRAIETQYKGYRFRSRLEARYAVMFDSLGLDWEYEPEGFELGDGLRYLPDFYIKQWCVWVEIKPDRSLISFTDVGKMRGFAHSGEKNLLLIIGSPGKEEMMLIDSNIGTTLDDIFADYNMSSEEGQTIFVEKFFDELEQDGSVYMGCIVGCDQPVLVRHMLTPDACWEITKATDRAKSARFEFGESGGPSRQGRK